MLRVAVVDDEAIQLEQIVDEVRKWQKHRKCLMNIQAFKSGKDLLEYCYFTESLFDIFLLDMQMDEMDGLQLGKEVRALFAESLIIYVTNYQEPVFEAFKVGTFRYILKSTLSTALCEALDSAIKDIDDDNKYFRYTYKKQNVKIEYNKIIYFESRKRIIKIVLDDGEIKEFYGKMSDVEESISDKAFVRCHQSFIVNVRYIDIVEGKWIQLRGKILIPISDRYFNLVEKTIMWSER